MKGYCVFVLVPLVGCVALWASGTVAFLACFRVFGVRMHSDYSAMIGRLPAGLSIATTTVCSFASFFLVTRWTLRRRSRKLATDRFGWLAVACLLFTVIADIVIAAFVEKLDVLAFPINAMYAFAWGAIIPAVLLARRRL